MPHTESHLRIGQVAARTGVSVHTLRFYEREGVFATPVHRDASGHRLYDEQHLEWVEVCSKLRESGMPLDAIRQYAELVRQGTGNEAERLNLLRKHQDNVRAQISSLIECLELINFKVRLYEACLTEGSTDPLLATLGTQGTTPTPQR